MSQAVPFIFCQREISLQFGNFLPSFSACLRCSSSCLLYHFSAKIPRGPKTAAFPAGVLATFFAAAAVVPTGSSTKASTPNTTFAVIMAAPPTATKAAPPTSGLGRTGMGDSIETTTGIALSAVTSATSPTGMFSINFFAFFSTVSAMIRRSRWSKYCAEKALETTLEYMPLDILLQIAKSDVEVYQKLCLVLPHFWNAVRTEAMQDRLRRHFGKWECTNGLFNTLTFIFVLPNRRWFRDFTIPVAIDLNPTAVQNDYVLSTPILSLRFFSVVVRIYAFYMELFDPLQTLPTRLNVISIADVKRFCEVMDRHLPLMGHRQWQARLVSQNLSWLPHSYLSHYHSFPRFTQWLKSQAPSLLA